MVVMTPREPRETWTDERLDEGFRELRAETVEVRKELGEVREGLGEVKAGIKGLEKKIDAKFDAMNRTMQIGFGLIGAVLTGILGLIAALFTIQL